METGLCRGGRGPAGRGELEALELEGGADGAGNQGPRCDSGGGEGAGGLPGMGGDDALEHVAGGKVGAKEGGGGGGAELERAAGLPEPELGGVDPVPVARFAGGQQEENGGAGAAGAVGRGVAPGLAVVTALGVRLEAEGGDDGGGLEGGVAEVYRKVSLRLRRSARAATVGARRKGLQASSSDRRLGTVGLPSARRAWTWPA